MTEYKLTLDIGSQNLSASTEDGACTKIPAVVAVENAGKNVVAVGVAALNLARANDNHSNLVYPILEGAIVDAEIAKVLFQHLFERILPSKSKIFGQVKVRCVVRCGVGSADKKVIENLLLSLGVRQVSFVATPVWKSAELFTEFHTNRGIVVDFGAECTDFAVVYGEQIVSGCTLYQGGKALTKALQDLVRRKYLVQLSFLQAETLKINCASLFSNDISTFNITGTNVHTGRAENLNIAAKETYNVVAEFVKPFVSIINSLLSSIPDQLSSAVRQTGVLLCGGGAQLMGLQSFLSEALGLPVQATSIA